MAFRIREVTIHLMAGAAPCMPASPGEKPTCEAGTCLGDTCGATPACKGRSGKPPHPQGDEHPGGKKRSLGLLQARLREALTPPPL